MPTAKTIGGFRFFFYSNEGLEPPHIHIERGDENAKFWLTPVVLAWSYGFNAHETNTLRRLVIENQAAFLEAWHGHFGS